MGVKKADERNFQSQHRNGFLVSQAASSNSKPPTSLPRCGRSTEIPKWRKWDGYGARGKLVIEASSHKLQSKLNFAARPSSST
jgi:hypothetical protein